MGDQQFGGEAPGCQVARYPSVMSRIFTLGELTAPGCVPNNHLAPNAVIPASGVGTIGGHLEALALAPCLTATVTLPA